MGASGGGVGGKFSARLICCCSMCFCLFAQTGQLEPLLNKFTEEEEEQMKRMLQRLDVLAKVG